MQKVLQKLKQFDAYPKTPEDVCISTYGGATITLISVFFISLMVFYELMYYIQPNYHQQLFVDTSRNPDIQINLDIMIPRISCDFVTLDAMDASGDQHLQIDHDIFKRRVNFDGIPIDEPKKDMLEMNLKKSALNKTEVGNTTCGSCYGTAKKCCNTCEEVRAAYREQQWAFPINTKNIEQCRDERSEEKLKTAFTEGCQIYGTLVVNRVSGSFHIAPGKSFNINHAHIHDVQPFSSPEFNTTHVIKHLSFGEKIEKQSQLGKKVPGKQKIPEHSHNPLKGEWGVAEEGATMFQYHIKIVPTQYVDLERHVINANQFSVTKHKKVVSIISGETGMPGIFFQYELAPFLVKIEQEEQSLGHLLTSICAIIGGVFTVAGLIDALFYHSSKLIQQKFEIGKLS